MNHILVTDPCYTIRKGAREGLSGNWKPALLSSLLYIAVLALPMFFAVQLFGKDFGTGVGNLYSLIVQGPFMLGYSYFILKLFRREPTSPPDVFYGFEHFGKAFLLAIVTTLFILLWSLLLIIPGVIASYRYRLAYYVILDNPSIGVLEAIAESKRLMRGNKGKLFILDLTFIGWALLAALTFGLGMIALLPYMATATVVFYELANGNITERTAQISYGVKPEVQTPKIRDAFEDDEIKS